METTPTDPLDASPRLTEHRKEWMERVLSNRTRHFTLVLEDLFDPHNISAVIRTAEVFGLQDVHIIEEINPYRINKSILKGSFKWMSIYLYKQRQRCYADLKTKGYQIAVASTNTTNTIHSLDLSIPTAFYLGTEFKGNHPDTLAQADVEFILPQYGVTESMNVSVAGGVLMAYLDFWMQKVGRDTVTLSTEERDVLRAEWYHRQVHGTEIDSPIHRIGNT
ncbi:MAG TPA: RNA methyltransferase [Fibrobacteraceae bacterium]|nr:RNA methyltransferase [Fibrobacteraceae bacterium]